MKGFFDGIGHAQIECLRIISIVVVRFLMLHSLVDVESCVGETPAGSTDEGEALIILRDFDN